MNGVLVVDKDPNWTSFDVVAKVRSLTGIKRCGHTGTLDPMATGVLPVLLGRATKLVDYFSDFPKEYEADLAFGFTTDSLDITGEILNRVEPKEIGPERVREALKAFVGDILQVPPMHSALKKDGVRLYELARQGQVLDLPPRPVTIHELELLDYAYPKARVRVVCGKGTYIRSLIRDLGEALGQPAVMTDLRRTKASGFSINQAEKLTELDRDSIVGRIIPIEKVLSHKEITLADSFVRLLTNGMKLKDPRAIQDHGPGLYLLRTEQGEFLGLVQIKGGELAFVWRAF